MSTTTYADLIKPCPFCGSDLRLKGAQSAAYFECSNETACGVTTNLVADLPSMIKFVNTRATTNG